MTLSSFCKAWSHQTKPIFFTRTQTDWAYHWTLQKCHSSKTNNIKEKQMAQKHQISSSNIHHGKADSSISLQKKHQESAAIVKYDNWEDHTYMTPTGLCMDFLPYYTIANAIKIKGNNWISVYLIIGGKFSKNITIWILQSCGHP